MSTIEFNLLPDVKMAYVKAAKVKKLVVSISMLVTAVCFGLLVIMLFLADVVQKSQLKSADKAIASATTQLKAIPNVDRIVTVQNQLEQLTTLHSGKHLSSRLFAYLPELTPIKAGISKIKLDFAANTMEISGTADTQQTVNQFIDTLKFTTYKIGDTDSTKAFPSVQETSFTFNSSGQSSGGNSGVDYSITSTFDPALFTVSTTGQNPILEVPSKTTTRSTLDDPANPLFNGTIKSGNDSQKKGN